MDAGKQVAPAPIAPGDPRMASSMQAIMARIQREARERPIRQLMFVGAARAVGTSLVVREAATQLVTGFAPLLVVEVGCDAAHEADLGRPPVMPVLNEGARSGAAIVHARLSADTCLSLFSAGKSGSDGLPRAWQELFELVLWDIQPPTVSPVGLAMSRRMDGIIVVVHANRTRRQVAQHVAARMEDSGGPLLGVVLNRTVSYIPEWIYRWL